MGVLHVYYYASFLFFSILLLVCQRSNCATVVVDGVTHWKNPTANIGDTIIFKHKNQYNLYIFRTEEAFKSCNFTQASPLSNLNSTTYTWHPSRIGSYYFGFYNNTNIPCEQGQKLTIKISTTTAPTPTPTPTPSPSPSPSPQPLSHSPAPATQLPATPGGSGGGGGGGGGGVVSSSPAYPWPFQPHEKQGASPGPAYTSVGISPMPAMSPAMGSMPFINSNPAVPLPTGEVDSATIQPLPTPANHTSQGVRVVGANEGVSSLCYVIIVTIMVILGC